MNEDVPSCRDLVRDEALAWFVRMRGPDAQGLQPQFVAWLGQGEDRRAEYQSVEALFEGAAVLKHSPRYGKPSSERAAHKHGRPALAFASVALLVGGLALAWHHQAGQPAAEAQQGSRPALATRRGEIRTYRLADGSSLTLDTNSRARLMRSGDDRHVRLLSGRARITIAKAHGLFLVDAGSGRLSARAGTFDVRFAPGGVTVSPLDGYGQVSALTPATSGPWSRANPLHAGSVFRYGTRSFASAAFLPATRQVEDRSWPSGWATYRSLPLASLVTEVNRYAVGGIVLDEADLGEKQVSGRFHLTDTQGFARHIADLFDLQVVRIGNEIHLRAR
jgi:transmembrane sensor